MAKKNDRRQINFNNKTLSFKFNNTITLSIMFVIIVTVGIILLVTYAYTQNSSLRIQKELTGDFISSIKTFDNDIKTRNFKELLPNLNKSFTNGQIVKYILVLDNNLKEIYTTHKGAKYVFRQPNNPNTLQISNVKNIKPIRIQKYSYNIYLGIDEKTISKTAAIDKEAIKIFFGIILIVIMIISYMLARSIAKPLSDMGKSISKISEGDLSGRLNYTNYYEINDLVNSYNIMADTLQQMYSTLEKQVQDRTVELESAYSELQNKTDELKSAYAELQSTQAMMVHSEKMKSLGELVAGIMHEINNPINFIYGNMTHLDNYSKDLIEIIETYTKHNDNLTPENLKEINDLKGTIDYEFLKSDMPDLIRSCREGADRAKNIIQDLKSFSRMEEVAITDVDIPHEIDTVLNILHNKIKHKAQIHKEYDENIPKVEAFGGQLNQVFMNILDNAIGVIETSGDIWIRINKDDTKHNLKIEIEDNGVGMDEETARKVFNPFFTTKPVGQGTGLGMSITYKIIKNHQGDIKVESKQGQGSKFIITLPLTIDVEKMNAAMISSEENND